MENLKFITCNKQHDANTFYLFWNCDLSAAISQLTFSMWGGGSLVEDGWGSNEPQSLQYVEYGSDGRGAKQ